MTTQEKVIDKIRKLNAMAEGAEKIGNRTEAEAFATKVQEMLLNHKLTMSMDEEQLSYQKSNRLSY